MSDTPDRRERLLNLLAALLETRLGLTQEELVGRPELGYPQAGAARRKAFTRDLASLRAMGVPVDHVEDHNVHRYRVDPKRYYLDDLELSAEELAALHVAVTAIGLGVDTGADALMKLGGREGAGSVPIARLPLDPGVPVLFDAVRHRCVASFRYRDRDRTVEPWGLTMKRGRWYLVGLDRGVDEMRVYRADRVAGPIQVGPAAGFEVPADFRPEAYLEDPPWQYDDGRAVEVVIRVDPGHTAGLVEIASDATITTEPDGGAVVTVRATAPEALLSFVLGFLEHAEIVSPPEVRAAMIERLERMAVT